MRPWFVVTNAVIFAIVVAIAAAGWWPIYQDLHFVILVAVTIVLGSALAILGAARKWSVAVLVPATVVLFALTGVALAVPTKTVYGVVPTLPGLLELFSSVALGWKQLLTITLPVGSYEGLLVPVFALLLVVVVGGLSIALRTRKAGIAAMAPVLLFVVGLAFGSREAAWPLVLSLSLLAVQPESTSAPTAAAAATPNMNRLPCFNWCLLCAVEKEVVRCYLARAWRVKNLSMARVAVKKRRPTMIAPTTKAHARA